MDMQKVIYRIEEAAKEQKKSLSQVSLDAGMSRDGIRNWKRAVLSGKNVGANHNNIIGVANALGLTAEWLISGNDTPVPIRVESGEGAPADETLITVYDVAASAGPGAVVPEGEDQAYDLAFPPNYLSKIAPSSNPKLLSIISVKGDSMFPTLKDDDLVMLDRGKTNLDYDGLFVLRFGDALHVKRITPSANKDCITVLSDNGALYPPRDWAKTDVTVVGKVVWKGGKV